MSFPVTHLPARDISCYAIFPWGYFVEGMDDWARIQPHFKRIVDGFPAGDHLDALLSQGLITKSHRTKYMNQSNFGDDSAINRDLFLLVLPRMGPQSFNKFCTWASQTESLQWVAELLQPQRYSSRERYQLTDAEQRKDMESVSTVQPVGSRDRYAMIHRIHSNVLIINNEHFRPSTNMGRRQGTGEDGRKLQQLFENLGCSCSVHADLTGSDMKTAVQRYAKNDHKDRDFAAICILTHGSQTPNSKCIVYGVDKGEVPVDELVEYFYGTVSPSLVGKPKLFFIQACQGQKQGYPVIKSPTCPITQRGLPVAEATDSSDARHVAALADGERAQTLPETADILVAYSTFPGYESYRDVNEGTYFIRHLVKVLQEQHHNTDLQSMMTEVKKKVAQEDIVIATPSGSRKDVKQMVLTWTTLTKDLYFAP